MTRVWAGGVALWDMTCRCWTRIRQSGCTVTHELIPTFPPKIRPIGDLCLSTVSKDLFMGFLGGAARRLVRYHNSLCPTGNSRCTLDLKLSLSREPVINRRCSSAFWIPALRQLCRQALPTASDTPAPRLAGRAPHRLEEEALPEAGQRSCRRLHQPRRRHGDERRTSQERRRRRRARRRQEPSRGEEAGLAGQIFRRRHSNSPPAT